MKKIILITGAFALFSTALRAQDHTQQQQRKEQNKTEMQNVDMKDNMHQKDSTGNINKKRKNKNKDSSRKMDRYNSNQPGSTDPLEQKHMDSTINNHR